MDCYFPVLYFFFLLSQKGTVNTLHYTVDGTSLKRFERWFPDQHLSYFVSGTRQISSLSPNFSICCLTVAKKKLLFILDTENVSLSSMKILFVWSERTKKNLVIETSFSFLSMILHTHGSSIILVIRWTFDMEISHCPNAHGASPGLAWYKLYITEP